MFAAVATGWASFITWFRGNPVAQWIAAFIAFAVGWSMLKAHLKQAGRDAERAAIAKKQAEVQLRVQEKKLEIIEQERSHADSALEARDSRDHYPTYDSLPDDLKRIANGGKGGGAGS